MSSQNIETVDISYIYAELRRRNYRTHSKLCCGRSRQRTDYYVQLNQIGLKKGTYKIKDGDRFLGSVTIP